LIAVGKPNPAKLGNFLEIDVFCIVSCAENALIDSKEYLKPLITPFELTLALDPSSGWNVDDYELDICNLDSAMEKTKLSINTTDDDDAPYFSLSTGKLVKKSTISNAIIYSEENSALVSRDTYTVSKIDNYFAASRFLAERTFQGLEQKIGETPVLVATEGRKGIAKGYQNEIDGLTLDIISAKVEQL
jgi:diphthamide biosynthesis protein 2